MKNVINGQQNAGAVCQLCGNITQLAGTLRRDEMWVIPWHVLLALTLTSIELTSSDEYVTSALLHSQLQRLRAEQPPPQAHMAVLPSFSVVYPHASDPRTPPQERQHHGGFHHSSGGFQQSSSGFHHSSGGFHQSSGGFHQFKGGFHHSKGGGGNFHHSGGGFHRGFVPHHREATGRSNQDLGSHLFSTPLIWAREASVHGPRRKRALPQVAAARLAIDPNVRLDLIRTLDNVKDATKDVCEHSDSPLYHIREALGSARDVFFSVVKSTPTGLLVPTTYRVSQVQPASDTVSAINPALLNDVGDQESFPVATDDTLQTVQSMLHDTLRGSRDSMQHVSDTVHSVRRAVLTAPKSAVRLLLPYLRALELQQSNKASAEPRLRATATQPHPFVGAGKLLELLHAATASDNSQERVSSTNSVACVQDKPGSKAYKELMKKIRKDFKNTITPL